MKYRRRIIRLVGLALAGAGCADTPVVKPVPKPDLMAFLDHDPVNRQDTYAHLGQPNAAFEQDRVLTASDSTE